MKRFTKILAMMLVVVMMVGMFSTVAFADNPFASVAEQAETASTGELGGAINNLGAKAINIIQTVGYVVAVVMVLVFGIKWMMATPQKKQELKERMWSLAIGVVLLIGGVTILGWIASFADTIQ